MSIGTISSPSSWYNGTIAPPTWFQNVQDTLNGVTAGSASVISLTAQSGAPASVTPAPAGTVKLTATLSATSVPTSGTTAKVLYADAVPLLWATITYSGGAGGTFTIGRAFNVSSMTRSGVGMFDIAPVTNFTNAKYAAMVNMTAPTSGGIIAAVSQGDMTVSLFSIEVKDTSGVKTDPGSAVTFNVLVLG